MVVISSCWRRGEKLGFAKNSYSPDVETEPVYIRWTFIVLKYGIGGIGKTETLMVRIKLGWFCCTLIRPNYR